MKLTFINDLGETYQVEIDPGMELENVMALLEAESGVPVSEQSISFQGRELKDPKKTMGGYEIAEDSMLIFRRKSTNVGGRQAEPDAETMRLQILGNPELMNQIRQAQPELAYAAANNPPRFAELFRELQRQIGMQRPNEDPYDIEAQRRIEEQIRQQSILENMEYALEFSPESFGRVTMLYIPVEVNSHPVKAFVDSGAQQTIMSPECAEACGIMRLVDKRYAGIARGVGTAKILGRVHTAQLKLAGLFLPCSFTIMEGRDVDLLFGLDMLKAHQACIDLEKNVLRIQGREVQFLSEHELPDKARFPEELLEATAAPNTVGGGTDASNQPSNRGNRNFPGSGQTLGPSPGAVTSGRQVSSTPANQRREESIQLLMDLGASREVAERLLDEAGGNADLAASMLF